MTLLTCDFNVIIEVVKLIADFYLFARINARDIYDKNLKKKKNSKNISKHEYERARRINQISSHIFYLCVRILVREIL